MDPVAFHNPSLSSDTAQLLSQLKVRHWKDRATTGWNFYCPLCAAARRLPFSPRPRARHLGQIIATTAMFVVLTWPWFGWKGVVAFLPLWTAFEFVYRSRVRAAIRCTSCGFDPCLYLVDAKRARLDVETFWQKKLEARSKAISAVNSGSDSASQDAQKNEA